MRYKVGGEAEFTKQTLVTYTLVVITPARMLPTEVESGQEMENAMNAFEVLFTLVFLRFVLPIGVLLLIGEWVQRHHRAQFHWR